MNLNGDIIDTNVVVRFLRSEDNQHADAVRLIEAAQAAGRQLVLLDIVVAETIYVLTTTYKLEREMVTDSMAKIIGHKAIGVASPSILSDALAYYSTTKLHFVDCYLVAVAKAAGRKIATFDRELTKFERLQMKEGNGGKGNGELGNCRK